MQYRFGSFVVDASTFEVRRGDEPIRLRRSVFDVLLHLIEHRDRVVSKDELLETVWKGRVVGETSIAVCVASLRQALGRRVDGEELIRTVYGRGYRFVPEARVVEPPTGGAAEQPDLTRLPFVGRRDELQRLRRALAEVSDGRARVALVSGEAGIGKTRLLEEIASEAEASGARVRFGRCRETSGAPPYSPWLRVLREERGLGGPGPPEGLERPSEAGARGARERLFREVGAALRKLQADRGLVVVLDDLHRADVPSLLLLDFVARELVETPFLLVGAYRDAELERNAERATAIDALSRLPQVEAVTLGGLSPDEVGQLVEQATTRALPPDRTQALHEQTGGNAFFLSRLVPFIGAARTFEGADALTWVEHLPASVRQAVTQQLQGLPDACRELLRLGAVLGRRFSLAALSSASGRAPEEVRDLLEHAVKAHVLVASRSHASSYRFAHVLVRDALYQQLGPLVRIRRHREVGSVLEALHAGALDEHAAELAHHFVNALGAGESRKALEYSVRAARWASRQLAYEDAAEHYQRALEVIELAADPDWESACDVLLGLAEERIRGGQREAAEAAFQRAAELAERLGSGERQARAALGMAPRSLSIELGHVDEPLIELLESALRAVGRDDSALRAKLLARLAMALYYTDRVEERVRLGVESRAVAERVGDPATLAYALSAAQAGLPIEALDERLAILRRVVELARKVDDREMALFYCLFLISGLLERGDVEEARAEMEVFRQRAESLGQPGFLWYLELFDVQRALLEARLDDAEHLIGRVGRAAAEAGERAAAYAPPGLGAMVALERGRSAPVPALLRPFAERYPGFKVWRCGIAGISAHAGDLDEARRELEAFARSDFRLLPRDHHWLVGMAMLTEAAAELGDVDRARRLYELQLPFRDRWSLLGYASIVWGPVAYPLGRLAATCGEWDAAEHHLLAALRRAQRAGARLHELWARCRLAQVLRARGRRDDLEASERLVLATRQEAQDLGLVLLSQQLVRGP